MATTFSNLLYHVVYSTKYRHPSITPDIKDNLYSYLGGIIRQHDGILLAAGGMPDHVHMLAKFSPRLAVADVLRDVKAGSSKWVNEQGLGRGRFEWQTGYGAFSVSFSHVDAVREYLANQAEHHRVTTFREEFLAMLRRHQIEFDEQYVFVEEHFG
jgi:REP element-mobilizing transposase RayT